MNINYTLPSVEQVFGEQRLDIFKAIGTQCPQTAFAAALGAEGSWLLSSAAGYGDVCIVKENGERAVGYASGGGGVRPAFACEDVSSVSDKVVKDISGHLLAEYGEYPQDAAEKMLARFLEDEHRSGMLRKTGKVYMGTYEEYEYKGTKYVRVKPEEERARWFVVSPLKWYYDETAGLLLCKSIIAFVREYCLDTVYEGDFSKTEACRFLNGTFAEDIVPSVLRKLTAEEQAWLLAGMMFAASAQAVCADEDYVDMWGRPEERSDNYAERVFEQFLSPGYIKRTNKTEVDDALAEVFAATNNARFFMGAFRQSLSGTNSRTPNARSSRWGLAGLPCQ